MMRIRTSRTINASREQLWPLLTNSKMELASRPVGESLPVVIKGLAWETGWDWIESVTRFQIIAAAPATIHFIGMLHLRPTTTNLA